MKQLLCAVAMLPLFGCVHIPDGVGAVEGFDAQRYLGTWYEIARFDHWFERGLINVSATYTENDDGTIRVVNRGFDPEKETWKEAVGKARFAVTPDIGRLKVSFFGPFYGGYNIIELDQDYTYALVCGSDRSYLWILAREPQLPEEVIRTLNSRAKSLGFDTDTFIYVEHNTP